MTWILCENCTDMLFWTSDHSVNRFNPLDLSLYGNSFLLSKCIQMFFPLTPRLEILFCDPIEYYRSSDKRVAIKDNVLFRNTLQVRSCARHVFSIDEDFFFAKKWLDEHTDFREIDRERITTT